MLELLFSMTATNRAGTPSHVVYGRVESAVAAVLLWPEAVRMNGAGWFTSFTRICRRTWLCSPSTVSTKPFPSFRSTASEYCRLYGLTSLEAGTYTSCRAGAPLEGGDGKE